MERKLTLANKYRPKTLDDVTEQGSIKIILENQIRTNTLKHAYLFCGGAGTGKTTTARIIANMMNEGKGRPFELDCASKNGVDDMRAIQQECATRPLNCKYSIFILDECFEGNSIVKTIDGDKRIKDIKQGDLVATSSGYNKVSKVYKKSIPNDRLVEIHLSNNENILTTVDHLFMTTNGWIAASQLEKGDELIVYNKLSELWKGDTYKQKREEILQQTMLFTKNKQEQQDNEDLHKEMCYLWKQFCCESQQTYKDLFCNMQKQINIAIREDHNEFRIWDGIKETSIRKNVSKQSNAQCSQYKKDDDYERIEWHVTSTFQGKRWKWKIYRSTNEVVSQFREFLGFGISNTNTDKKKQQSNEISYIVQSRPWLSFEDDSSRGGWQIPQYEKWYTERYQKTNQVGRIRVESITFYKQTSNREYRLCDNDYTEMYDLSVEGDCTYFMNNVLVHNCHMLSTQAWNSMLKILEEPPDYVIFLFCTTDPQKIIGTILSRVQRFNFSRISTKGIESRLKYIIDSENKEWVDVGNTEVKIQYEQEAISYIARLARGGMRDAITTLEKCLDFDPKLTLSNVQKVLSGGVTEETELQFLTYLINRDCKSALLLFNDIYLSGMDIAQFIKLYIEFLQNCIKYIITKDTGILTVSDITVKWLEQNGRFLTDIRNQLVSAYDIKTTYSSEDMKVLVESWIIELCI